MRLCRLAVARVPLLAALGCGGGDLVLPSESGPARIEIIGGDGQTGSAGAALADSLVVRVLDGQDRAVSGLRVAFALAEGTTTGQVAPDTVVTDNRGLAAAEWVLGSGAGAQGVDATVVGEGLTETFTASATSGAASRLVTVSGDDQIAPVGTDLPDSLVVRVEDPFGNPVGGVQVVWATQVGSLSPESVVSGPDGRAATRRILGSAAGEQSATAAAAGLDGSPVTFTHTAVPGTAASLVLISGSGQTGPPGEELQDPLVVRVVDQAGNGIAGQAVTWVVATGGGSVDPGTSQTDAEGFASTGWTLGPSNGPNTLNAVASGVGVVGFTAEGRNGGGGGGGGSGPSAGLSTVTATPTSIQAITGTATITVTVRNGSGQPVPGASVTLEATGSGNILTQPGGQTGADGVVTGALRSSVPGTKVVAAIVNGSVEVNQTAQVTVTLAPAVRVELLEGDGQTAPAGTAVDIRPAVRVLDAGGQPVAGFGVTFVVTGGDGSVDGASQTTNSDGVARVGSGSWTLGSVPGTNTLEARAGTLQGSPIVFTAEGQPAAARLIFLTQPEDVDEDELFDPPVRVGVVDGSGNPVSVSGIEIRIELLETDGRGQDNRLDGDATVATVDGVAVFADLSVDRNDEYRLRASAPDLIGVDPVLSDAFEVD